MACRCPPSCAPTYPCRLNARPGGRVARCGCCRRRHPIPLSFLLVATWGPLPFPVRRGEEGQEWGGGGACLGSNMLPPPLAVLNARPHPPHTPFPTRAGRGTAAAAISPACVATTAAAAAASAAAACATAAATTTAVAAITAAAASAAAAVTAAVVATTAAATSATATAVTAGAVTTAAATAAAAIAAAAAVAVVAPAVAVFVTAVANKRLAFRPWQIRHRCG